MRSDWEKKKPRIELGINAVRDVKEPRFWVKNDSRQICLKILDPPHITTGYWSGAPSASAAPNPDSI